MHPTLFLVPLPAWNVPLAPVFVLVAGVGLALSLFALYRHEREWLRAGGAVTLAGAIAALALRGQSYPLSPLPVHGFGAMLCLSLVVGWILTLGLAERDGLARPLAEACYLVTALAALVGARLLYALANARGLASAWEVFAVRRGGFFAYGGFVGGALGSWLFLRQRGEKFLRWADVAAPSLAAGVFLTRIGCYLFGCDFGKPLGTNAPAWLKALGTFPRWSDSEPAGAGSAAWLEHVRQRGLSPDAWASLPVHPTQLYEALCGLVLLAAAIAVRRQQRFRGEVFFVVAFAYGAARFAIEMLRDDPERGAAGPAWSLRTALLLGASIFAIAFAVGPARSIASVRVRAATRVLAAVAVLGVFIASAHLGTAPVQLSPSQWLALSTAVVLASVWKRFEATPENPEQPIREASAGLE